MKKIVLYNILVLLIICFACEMIAYISFLTNRYGAFLPYIHTKQDILKSTGAYPLGRFEKYDESQNYEKAPILLLGCSYTYGQWLDDNQNFSAKLKQLTNRHVYNFGMIGQGPMAGLTLLNIEEKQPSITKAPEYVIYTYMFQHIQRWNWWRYYNELRKYNFINFQKYHLTDNLFLVSHFRNTEVDKYFCNDKDLEKRLTLLLNIINAMKEKSKKLYPNSKFVVLLYSDINKDLCPDLAIDTENEKYFDLLYSAKFKEKIENLGIKVLSTEELIGRKMDKPDDRITTNIDPNHPHPSEKAWNEIVPKLVKTLNL